MEAIFQPEGKVLLPPMTPNTTIEDLTSVVTAVAKELGNAGMEAMRQYLKECRLESNEVAMGTLRDVFVANPHGRKTKKRTRT